MRRLDVPEIEDQPWCPRAVRDGGTDWLAFMANATGAFHGVAPLLAEALRHTGTRRVIDLCSGGGGPWPTLAPVLAEHAEVDTIELTDRFPNVDALRQARDRSGGLLSFRERSVDATDVPEGIAAVRTMFNCFHHFPPDAARAVLNDAVRKRRAIAIFEGVDHRALGLLGVAAQLPMVLLATPFVRPPRLSRYLLTYLVPLIPALILFDGTMSMLRLYLADELRELVASVDDHESFEWRIGSTPIPRAPVGITHLVGLPR